jgi:hypothetical protein
MVMVMIMLLLPLVLLRSHDRLVHSSVRAKVMVLHLLSFAAIDARLGYAAPSHLA